MPIRTYADPEPSPRGIIGAPVSFGISVSSGFSRRITRRLRSRVRRSCHGSDRTTRVNSQDKKGSRMLRRPASQE